MTVSTYGLERTNLNKSIGLDDSEIEVDPQNANPRGAHGGEGERDILEEIIKIFNERFFQGWDATLEDQRIKFVSLSRHIQKHPNFAKKYAQNCDSQNSDIALKKILKEIMSAQRNSDIEFNKKLAKDDEFERDLFDSMRRVVDESELSV